MTYILLPGTVLYSHKILHRCHKKGCFVKVWKRIQPLRGEKHVCPSYSVAQVCFLSLIEQPGLEVQVSIFSVSKRSTCKVHSLHVQGVNNTILLNVSVAYHFMSDYSSNFQLWIMGLGGCFSPHINNSRLVYVIVRI